MADEKRKVLAPSNMGGAGWDILHSREDILLIPYPPTIAAEELHNLLLDAAGIVVSFTPFGRAEVDAAPLLQVVARIGVGYDAVDVAALTARRIPLMTTGLANSTSVAEKALYFMLALAKRATLMDRLVREGRWHDRYRAMPMEVAGKTVLVVGFGRIGTRTARRCAALEMRVLVYDPYVAPEAIRSVGYEPAMDLDAALPVAEFVTIHCPKNSETIGMFGAARLAGMKHGAALINTARGGIVEEAALHEALASGHLGGAGLDVFEAEPPSLENALLRRDDVLTAPHMAGVTAEAVAAMAQAAARNVLSVLDGAPLAENVVNRAIID
ncbi:MAG: hydroxyacid dehydrogenase [Acetobacteraceae bacterium]|nr:hydroxyacid dehydrogenase [Acetobacteraceae bacterium]